MKLKLLSVIGCVLLMASSSPAAGPPFPQPLHNVRAVRVAGLSTQVEADRVMDQLRKLRSVWLVTDLTPASGYVRVGFDVRAVNEHAIAQTIMNQGAYTVTTHFTLSDYAAHAAAVDAIFEKLQTQYPVKYSRVDSDRGEFALTYLPITLDPENPRKVGFAGGFMHHPLSVDKPPKGLGLKFTDISAPKTDRILMPKTHMTFRGKLLLVEDFAKPVTLAKRTSRDPETWSDGWRVKNGKWAQVDGGIRGIVLPKIYPAATLHLPLAGQDVVIQVEARLDAIPLDDPPKSDYLSASVVLREADARHIASARLSKSGFAAGKDATKGRAVNGVVVDDKDVSFGRQTPAIKPGEWHTILIEVRGEEMLATLDGGSPVLGSHPILSLAKGILSFGTPRSASFRNLRVFEALPNPEWEKNKAVLATMLPASGR